MLEQPRIQSFQEQVSPVTVDNLIVNHIIQSIQPFSLIEEESFIDIFKTLQPYRTVMSRKTLVNKINLKFNEMKDSLTEVLKNLDYVSATADCWTANKRYSGLFLIINLIILFQIKLQSIFRNNYSLD